MVICMKEVFYKIFEENKVEAVRPSKVLKKKEIDL